MYELAKPFFVLAPMDDVTDTVFRRVVKDCAAPDLFFTEFVNVDGLQSPGRAKLLKKLCFTEPEQPLIAQIWGKDPVNFESTARQIADGSLAAELGLPDGVNYAGVDLNMGCPQKAEVNSGTCSALMNNRELAQQIISATKKGLNGRLPVSVKTRTGFNNVDLSWIEFLLRQDLDMLTIHGRTRKEKSKVPANWDHIGEASVLRDKISGKTLIVGNGDVTSRQQGDELATQYSLDGIMIGRGIFSDPYIFAEDSPWAEMSPLVRLELYKKHIKLFAKTWKKREKPIQILNKFCKIYVNDFSGAKMIRERLMKACTLEELFKEVDTQLKLQRQLVRVHQPAEALSNEL